MNVIVQALKLGSKAPVCMHVCMYACMHVCMLSRSAVVVRGPKRENAFMHVCMYVITKRCRSRGHEAGIYMYMYFVCMYVCM